LDARNFGATGALIGATGPVRAVATVSHLLQPALGHVDRPLDFFPFRSRGLTFCQFALPGAQFLKLTFDLAQLALAHLSLTPVGARVLGAIPRPAIPLAPIARSPIARSPIARSTIARSAIFGTAIFGAASLRATILHPASFARSTITGATITGSTVLGSTISGCIRLGPPTFGAKWAGGTRGAAAVFDQLLFGSQLGLRPRPTGITRRILGSTPQQTHSQHQPQIPRHVVFLPVSVSKNLGE
jgi:hypothetical protein